MQAFVIQDNVRTDKHHAHHGVCTKKELSMPSTALPESVKYKSTTRHPVEDLSTFSVKIGCRIFSLALAVTELVITVMMTSGQE
jgi:hypothetical protein